MCDGLNGIVVGETTHKHAVAPHHACGAPCGTVRRAASIMRSDGVFVLVVADCVVFPTTVPLVLVMGSNRRISIGNW